MVGKEIFVLVVRRHINNFFVARSSEHFNNLNYLLLGGGTLEQRLVSKQLCEAAACAPNVDRLIVILVAKDKLGCTVVSRANVGCIFYFI